ncbi:MAG: RNA polymerase sigma factor [Prevotella sp.]|nr:RNA polymerase sigma factor [Prevotella sp.]
MKEISFRTDVLPLKDELFRLALRITLNRADAEDIVQETMLKVWNRRDSWSELESIEAYCLTICRNLALDKVKRADSQQPSLDDTDEKGHVHEHIDHSYDANPEEQAVQRDRVALVRQLINQLPEKQKSCMQLRDMEGKPYKEIAQVLGITEQQVKVNIFRARQAIKERFQQIEQHGL